MARVFILIFFMVFLATPTHAAGRTLCVFDVVGRYGDVFGILTSYRNQVLGYGVSLNMQVYQEEIEAIEAFDRGECDLVALSDVGARRFNNFTGSISAIGAIPHYGDLRLLSYTLANRRLSPLLENDSYQILGVLPLGSVYLFVSDRSISTVEAMRGKRISILENHEDARHMAEFVGAVPVPARISTFARLFRSGEVEVSYAPAAAYEVLEMEKGMGENGGIVRYPVGQLTTQLVARKGTFDDEFVQRSRKIMANLFSDALRATMQFERAVPESRWIDIPAGTRAEYQEMLRQVRLDILKGENATTRKLADIYHPSMLKLLRKIRCHTNPAAEECRDGERE